MKVIEILVKLANGEEVPKKIEYSDILFTYNAKERDYISEGGNYLVCSITSDELNDKVEIIEDTEEDKRIEDRARFQYSEIPNWLDIHGLITVVNNNFEKHQKALDEIIDKINGD